MKGVWIDWICTLTAWELDDLLSIVCRVCGEERDDLDWDLTGIHGLVLDEEELRELHDRIDGEAWGFKVTVNSEEYRCRGRRTATSHTTSYPRGPARSRFTPRGQSTS